MSDFDDGINGAGLNEAEEQDFLEHEEQLEFGEEDGSNIVASNLQVIPQAGSLADFAGDTPTERMMQSAVESGNIEVLERLITLKQSEEDRAILEEQRQAKMKFDKAFAKMQIEFGPIKRKRNNKQYNSKYAELSDLQIQYGPILSKHKFSYDWETVPNEDGSMLCTFLLTIHGYTKRTTVPIPAYTPATGNTSGKDIMNPMQAVGTQLSYGERYSMKAGLGVTETDEDTDGVVLTFDEGLKYGEWSTAFDLCTDKEELKQFWSKAMQQLESDPGGRKVVTHLRNLRYEEIKKAAVNGR